MDSIHRSHSSSFVLLLLLVLLPSSSLAQFSPSPSPSPSPASPSPSDPTTDLPPSPSAFSPDSSPPPSFDVLSPLPSPDLSPSPSPYLAPSSPPQYQEPTVPSPSPDSFDVSPLDPSLASHPTDDNAGKRDRPTVSQKAGIAFGLLLCLFVVGMLAVVCKKRRDNIRRSQGLLDNNKYGQLHGRSVQMTEV